MPKNNDMPKLFDFGLSDHESRIYTTLVSHGPCTMAELALKASVPRTKVYPNIRRLVRKGFVEILPEKPLKCRATSPEEALKSVLQTKEDEIDGMKKTYGKLLELFKESSVQKSLSKREFWVIEDSSHSAETLRSELAHTNNEAFFLVNNYGSKMLLSAKQDLIDASSRGVKIRILVSDHDLADKLAALSGFAELRMVTHQSRDSLALMDGNTVFIFSGSRITDAQVKGATLYIRDAKVCESLRWLVNEAIWEESPRLENVLSIMEYSSDPGRAIKAASSSIYSNAIIFGFGQWLIEKYGAAQADKVIQEIAERTLELIEKEEGIRIMQGTIDKTLKVIADLASISENIEVEFSSDDPLKSLLYVVNGALSIPYKRGKTSKSNHLLTAWALLMEAAFSKFGYDTYTLQTVYDKDRDEWITKKRVVQKGLQPVRSLDQIVAELSKVTIPYVEGQASATTDDRELSSGAEGNQGDPDRQ